MGPDTVRGPCDLHKTDGYQMDFRYLPIRSMKWHLFFSFKMSSYLFIYRSISHKYFDAYCGKLKATTLVKNLFWNFVGSRMWSKKLLYNNKRNLVSIFLKNCYLVKVSKKAKGVGQKIAKIGLFLFITFWKIDTAASFL